MKYLTLAVGSVAASPFFESPDIATALLSRKRRNNNGLFEEARAADLTRECVDEICSYDEVFEVFEDQAQALEWWNKATKMCSKPDACFKDGTATCVNLWRARRCECKD